MNRRGFLSFSLLAPVAGVMAARDAMAAPAAGRWINGNLVVGEVFIGESVGETTQQLLERAHRVWHGQEIFGVDGGVTRSDALAFVESPAEDESVSAQFTDDLAFLRDEPGVAI
jgi:hypothetical protein